MSKFPNGNFREDRKNPLIPYRQELPQSKFSNGLLILAILFGCPLLVWAYCSSVADAYSLWKFGVEKRATIVALDHTERSRGGANFYYEIEIEGHATTHGFFHQMPVGKSVSVIVQPDQPERMVLGDRSSSLFEIYSRSVGGTVVAILYLAMIPFIIWGVPTTLWALHKSRKLLAETKLREDLH